MHPIRLGIVILMTAILQVAIDRLLSFSFRPDLLVILLVYLVTSTEGNWPIIAAFAVGFAADLISLPVGPNTIAFGIAGSLLAMTRRSVTFDNPLLVALAVFAVCLVGGAIGQILAGFKQAVGAGAFKSLFWMSLASAVIGPYLYSILSVASGFLGTRPPRAGRRK